MFMFKYFLVTLIVVYIAYYAVMLFIDIKKIKKSRVDESKGQEVDISKAVEGYKAKNASAIIRESIKGNQFDESVEEPTDEMDMDYSNEAPAVSDEEFIASQTNEDNNLPFVVDGGDNSGVGDNTDNNGGVGRAQKLENVEVTDTQEYAPIEHSAGVNVLGLSHLFEQANLEESLFKDVRLSA